MGSPLVAVAYGGLEDRDRDTLKRALFMDDDAAQKNGQRIVQQMSDDYQQRVASSAAGGRIEGRGVYVNVAEGEFSSNGAMSPARIPVRFDRGDACGYVSVYLCK
jgi:hypothetical protein